MAPRKRSAAAAAKRDVASPPSPVVVRRNTPWLDCREVRNAAGELLATLYLGDCVEVMGALEPATMHAVVTDPPYELGFMGKSWDEAGGVASDPETWRRAFDALKPGGHITAFAGSRTYHRIACAIEDAGFEIRDQLMWLYGSGFPKSHDIAKCIAKAGGVWRGRSTRALPDDARRAFGQHYERTDKGRAVTADAQAWDGWGTALKPAHEPIALGRKPFRGTVANNCLVHGTGGLNIDGCRVGDEVLPVARAGQSQLGTFERTLRPGTGVTPEREGRWPANVLTDGSLEVLEAFPPSARDAIRFFYSPKADRREREFGLDDVTPTQMAPRTAHDRDRDRLNRNIHPTVKPIDLMAWLCRLTTPAGGTVLEPFLGSGSTGIAAVRHGFRIVGIEQSPEYFEIAHRRIVAAVAADDAMPRLDREITRATRALQLSMFEGTS